MAYKPSQAKGSAVCSHRCILSVSGPVEIPWPACSVLAQLSWAAGFAGCLRTRLTGKGACCRFELMSRGVAEGGAGAGVCGEGSSERDPQQTNSRQSGGRWGAGRDKRRKDRRAPWLRRTSLRADQGSRVCAAEHNTAPYERDACTAHQGAATGRRRLVPCRAISLGRSQVLCRSHKINPHDFSTEYCCLL